MADQESRTAETERIRHITERMESLLALIKTSSDASVDILNNFNRVASADGSQAATLKPPSSTCSDSYPSTSTQESRSSSLKHAAWKHLSSPPRDVSNDATIHFPTPHSPNTHSSDDNSEKDGLQPVSDGPLLVNSGPSTDSLSKGFKSASSQKFSNVADGRRSSSTDDALHPTFSSYYSANSSASPPNSDPPSHSNNNSPTIPSHQSMSRHTREPSIQIIPHIHPIHRRQLATSINTNRIRRTFEDNDDISPSVEPAHLMIGRPPSFVSTSGESSQIGGSHSRFGSSVMGFRNGSRSRNRIYGSAMRKPQKRSTQIRVQYQGTAGQNVQLRKFECGLEETTGLKRWWSIRKRKTGDLFAKPGKGVGVWIGKRVGVFDSAENTALGGSEQGAEAVRPSLMRRVSMTLGKMIKRGGGCIPIPSHQAAENDEESSDDPPPCVENLDYSKTKFYSGRSSVYNLHTQPPPATPMVKIPSLIWSASCSSSSPSDSTLSEAPSPPRSSPAAIPSTLERQVDDTIELLTTPEPHISQDVKLDMQMAERGLSDIVEVAESPAALKHEETRRKTQSSVVNWVHHPAVVKSASKEMKDIYRGSAGKIGVF
ncbi:hypothetical protein HDU81_002511 [Chytriomyces hyalinus]|nr:hypothetical protein HDU81_002511 [Chytriomyces hyalinus]